MLVAHEPSAPVDPARRKRERLLFVGLALLLGWGLAAYWYGTGRRLEALEIAIGLPVLMALVIGIDWIRHRGGR